MELIHLRIDGEASPPELAELEVILKGSEEAQTAFETMNELAATLESAPLAEAPATLKADVLATIRSKEPSRLQWNRHPFPPKRRKVGSATNFPLDGAVLTTEPGAAGLTNGWRQRMDSQKKKRNFLIGFGGVAVVLVTILATWPPAFMNEDASGAIGAVQKHRAPQITAKDVVLVDEATKKEEAVLYADFLSDAAKLENISAELGVAMRNRADNLEARSPNASSFENVAIELQGHRANLQVRYLASMSDALSAASQLLARDASALSPAQIESATSDIEALSAKLQNRQQIASEEMEALNARLESISQMLEARSSGVRPRRTRPARSGSLENIEALENEIAALEARSSGVRPRRTRPARSGSLENIEAALENEIAALEARSTGDRQRRSRRGRSVSLENIEAAFENEISALEKAAQLGSDIQLEATAKFDSLSRDLQQAVSTLDARLEQRENHLEAIVLELRSLQNVENALEALNRDQLNISAELAARLESANRDLGIRANELESRAIDNMESRLKARDEMAARIQNIETQLESSRKALESRASELGKSSADLLGRVTRELQVSSAELQSRMSARTQSELGSIESRLDSRRQLSARLQNVPQLEARKLGIESQLEARGKLGSRLQNHLGALTQALESRSAGADLQARQNLQLQVRQLQSRVAADLEARNQ